VRLVVDTSYTTADAYKTIILDGSSNSVNYNLPTSPNQDLEITFYSADITNDCTVTATGGLLLNNATSVYTFREGDSSIRVKYIADLGYWILIEKE